MEESNIVHQFWLEYCDNQENIQISWGRGYIGQEKYIKLSFLAIKEIVNRGHIVQICFLSNKNTSKILKNALLSRANEIGTKRLKLAVTQ